MLDEMASMVTPMRRAAVKRSNKAWRMFFQCDSNHMVVWVVVADIWEQITS